jgi:hypothetical protein
LKVGPRAISKWNWAEFNALPKTRQTRDIHCVTKWSKLDTPWEGVLIDDILAAASLTSPPTKFVLAHSFDGYSTNVPPADLVSGKAMVALNYEGKPLQPDHGGPARLLVPHLYFWKSGKWVSGLQFTQKDEPGFWELRGHHIYGDPWREQRFARTWDDVIFRDELIAMHDRNDGFKLALALTPDAPRRAEDFGRSRRHGRRAYDEAPRPTPPRLRLRRQSLRRGGSGRRHCRRRRPQHDPHRALRRVEHDPEKWEPIFRKDHAQ